MPVGRISHSKVWLSRVKTSYLPLSLMSHTKTKGTMTVIQVTSKEFREKPASVFALADEGNSVVIKRRGKVSYMLIPVSGDDLYLSPELEERLEEGRRQYQPGNVTTCSTKEELNGFLDSL